MFIVLHLYFKALVIQTFELVYKKVLVNNSELYLYLKKSTIRYLKKTRFCSQLFQENTIEISVVHVNNKLINSALIKSNKKKQKLPISS